MLTLRPYQQAAVAAIYGYFEVRSGHPLIVIPTAGGKALVMAAFIESVLKAWPDQRILIVTHVRELIAQNHAEMLTLWPGAPAGIYSAGIGRRDADARILFAGIQSVHKRAAEIGHADLVLVDEAHLIPGSSNTMYRRLLDDLTGINPKLKVIGFTATPFRLDSGMLHQGDDALFTDIAFEVPVRDLIDAGYLSPLVSKEPRTRLSVAGVGTRSGEFIARELQAAVDTEAITRAAIDEVIAFGADRTSWLAFKAAVDHASHVAGAETARRPARAPPGSGADWRSSTTFGEPFGGAGDVCRRHAGGGREVEEQGLPADHVLEHAAEEAGCRRPAAERFRPGPRQRQEAIEAFGILGDEGQRPDRHHLGINLLLGLADHVSVRLPGLSTVWNEGPARRGRSVPDSHGRERNTCATLPASPGGGQ